MIKAREINIKSDCGHYTITAQLITEQDGYSYNHSGNPRAMYVGSHWEMNIRKDGKRVNGIQVRDGNYQPFISVYGVFAHGIKLSKNNILYLAHVTRMFKNELKDVDTKKVEKAYYKEYIAARIVDGTL